MSTPVLVDLESSTQADGAQISRVPVQLLKDPYEAIRQAYLDGTDTKSEPFEDPINTETLELPLTITPPTSLSESTPPILVPILRRAARMAVCIPPAMSSGLSASMAEVAAMSESVFRKRFRSSYESSPFVSPLDLPSQKRYRGTSELVEDSEEDVDEEDEEIEESMDSDSVSEDAVGEGPTAEDEDPAAGDEGLTSGVEGPGMDDESYGLDDESYGMDDESRGLDDEGHGVESDGLSMEEKEEAVPGGQPQEAPVVGTAVSASLGLGYGALRRRQLALEEDHVYSTFEVGQGSRFALESGRPERVSASRQPTLTTWTDPEDGMVYIDVPAYPPPAPPVQTPPSPEWTSGSLHISLSPSVVPSPISSPMIPLSVPSPVATLATVETEGFLTELGAQVEMQGGLIRDHTLQLAEERRARLELAKVVDAMRRGQEPRGGV
ncbi:hypothetical protein Tco_0802690 [Tanacetum coccineum]|uniref:Uncharacterized protein n=1 Tax=Tanacetum coccineum TaxID=301880 RepID=A0ABQ5A353_9ASTR